MIKVENYSKSYSGKKVVDNISFTVEDGEIFGFIGHNGAGKTTTIKSIVGILDFEEGRVLINGMDIKKQPIECKKLLAYIPDNPDIYENLKAIEYLNFIADIYNVSRETRLDRFRKYADLFGMTEYLGDEISTYSHGMKQKLVIIAALVHDPKIIIFDEPFVGLDPKAVFDLKEVMRKLCETGASIFFSTHILDVAERLCDKVAIIKSGKIVKIGKMEEIKGDSSLENVFLELV
ncbi:MAG: ABC transporter ATP-binding protein [Clostridia bacterium]|nr:ABC transporter ATP-binding protein [Clostridia bacterium]